MDSHKPTFEQVYRTHGDYAYSLARRLCRGDSEAEDVFQEACLRIYRFLPGFRGDSLKGWIRRIVTNAFYDARHKVRKIYPAEELQPPEADLAVPGEDPALQHDEKSLEWRTERALARLPDEHRGILLLRAQDDLSYEELAELLKIPVGTVRSRLSRARTAFRQLLARVDGEGTPDAAGAVSSTGSSGEGATPDSARRSASSPGIMELLAWALRAVARRGAWV